MYYNLRLHVLVGFMLAACSSCEVRDDGPAQQVPDITNIISSFVAARDRCEGACRYARKTASTALREGERLYIEAQATHNAAVAKVSAVLATRQTIDQTDLRRTLAAADDARAAFLNWYESNIDTGEKDFMELVSLLEAIIDCYNASQQRSDDRLIRLIRQVDDCQMRGWDDLAVD